MKLISQPLDFLGQNIYNAVTVRAGEMEKQSAQHVTMVPTDCNWLAGNSGGSVLGAKIYAGAL